MPLKENPLNNLKTVLNDNIIQGECRFGIKSNICFNSTDIKTLKDNYNNDTNNDTVNKVTMGNVFKQYKCDTQKCIARRFDLNDDVFKSDGPYNTKNLLNNSNIDNVLRSYEYIFHDFKHLSFTMDDWHNNKNTDIYKLCNEVEYVCSFLNSGKRTIGFILNTDIWAGKGTHWVCMFCDFRGEKTWYVDFFNSSGNNPSLNTKKLTNAIINNVNNCSIKPSDTVVSSRVLNNKNQQNSETECGLYSLYVIYCRCKNLSLDYFKNIDYERIKDNTMTEFRSYIFYNNYNKENVEKEEL